MSKIGKVHKGPILLKILTKLIIVKDLVQDLSPGYLNSMIAFKRTELYFPWM
jgi:hypothetical protein